jgi:hypothetical protein
MVEPVNAGFPLLRVVPPAQLEAALDKQARDKAAIEDESNSPQVDQLAAFVRTRYEMFRNHRNDAIAGWSLRLLQSMRAFTGRYDPEKLAEIKKFGGSDIYARVIAMKCRGASSLLRDVYLSGDRAWGLDPAEDPDIPPEIAQAITQLVQSELQEAATMGVPPPQPNAIKDRIMQLMESAREAAKKKAQKQSQLAEDKIDEMLVQGGFYKALSEFIVDLPIFPFAVMKGPVVKIVPTVTWANGAATVEQKPKLFWSRISPFDIWWTPGVNDIEDAEVIEKQRISRAELNDLLDLPGYNHDNIRKVLEDYGRGGLSDNWDSTDAERAWMESRENPMMNRSGLISTLEYHGPVQGQMLLEYGIDKEQIPDPLRDYHVQAWLIGSYIIKCQLTPSPRKRHPYFITSFEKVPGTVLGNGLTDILGDIQEAANATLRSLVNNLSISSGPQVIVNDERLAPNEDGEDMFPWKRWHVISDPLGGGSQMPISFFQPNSNAQELIGVYTYLNNLADDVSAIPKFISGGGAGAGAGRTASGLSMLMSNASKILQTVAANIDRDIFEPLLGQLFDLLMLTDQTGMLTGQEQVRVMGVSVAVQRETQRARQLEFLQATANPVDMQIIGPKGRAEVLRAVSNTLGLEGGKVVPTEEELDQQQQMAQAAAMQQGIPGHAGVGENAAQAQGNQPSPLSQDTGPRTKIAGGPQ